MTRMVGVLLMLVLGAASCRDRPLPVAAVAPFDALGVAPGMSARETRTQRPGAVFSPYTGLSESLGDRTVLYRFPDVDETDAIRTSLDEIVIADPMQRDTTAVHARFLTEVARVSRALQRDPRCGTMPLPSSTGETASWQLGQATVLVQHWQEADSARVVLVHRRGADPRIVYADSTRCIRSR